MAKSYDPAAVEKDIFAFWQAGGWFEAQPDAPGDAFCMVIPPPNVTGALHLGHALNNTLQDILVRRARMQGRNAFWLIGTDHAGIATQATVEKTIRKEENKSRHDLGRDEMVKRIWAWKEKFGGRIVEQLKLMGCSCDYARERFTLDDMCAKAVRHTFFKLFRDGLIYRGKRLVNWDTQLRTAVADDEVVHETVKGKFYYFKYPVIDPKPSEPEFVHIATTRPETMLADTAVAVHPEPAQQLDEAAAKLRDDLATAKAKDVPQIEAALEHLAERRHTMLPLFEQLRDMAKDGRKIRLPLTDREIPLICDEWANPALGTGCVKITPAHDPNDYDVAQRHNLSMINVLTEYGKVADIVEPDGSPNSNSSKYAGLAFSTDGRRKVVEDLEALGLVEKIEDRQIELGHSDRSKAPIEPYLSDQWFVKMGDLTPEEFQRVRTQQFRDAVERHANSSERSDKSEPRPSGSGGRSNARPADPTEKRTPGLAQIAIDVVKDNRVTFHPARYEKTYVDWLSEKRDWCISRQLWWGHRIPVWHASELRPVGAGIGAVRIEIEQLQESLSVESFWTDRGEMIGIDGQPRVRRIFLCVKETPNDADISKLRQFGFSEDPDVLDTWFSSALWPHSTLGWPDAAFENGAAGGQAAARAEARGSSSNATSANHEPPASAGADATDQRASLLATYYPTSVLSTAREIITLWVARMVMTGLYNVGDIPFHDVVIHPVIQDGQGRKMSKSLGNGVDPVDIIDFYGADALRFTLADLATETQDIRMPVKKRKLPDGREVNVSDKFEQGRNFCNKLWQAATGYVMQHLDGYAPAPLDPAALRLEDRWILSRTQNCLLKVNAALNAYRFSEAMETLYHFMWSDYCSDYIEMTKARLDGDERAAAQQILVHVLDTILRMLHPFIPFVTEAIWKQLNESAPTRGLTKIEPGDPALIAAKWPAVDEALIESTTETEMAMLQALIRSVRDTRSTVNDYRSRAKQPTVRTLPRVVVLADEIAASLVNRYSDFVTRLAGCDAMEVRTDGEKPAGALTDMAGALQVCVPAGDLVDLEDVRRTQRGKLDELRKQFASMEKRMSNESYANNAPPEIVAETRARMSELRSQMAALAAHLGE